MLIGLTLLATQTASLDSVQLGGALFEIRLERSSKGIDTRISSREAGNKMVVLTSSTVATGAKIWKEGSVAYSRYSDSAKTRTRKFDLSGGGLRVTETVEAKGTAVPRVEYRSKYSFPNWSQSKEKVSDSLFHDAWYPLTDQGLPLFVSLAKSDVGVALVLDFRPPAPLSGWLWSSPFQSDGTLELACKPPSGAALPKRVSWSYHVVAQSKLDLNSWFWKVYGSPLLKKGVPQTIPFHFYSRPIYTFSRQITPESQREQRKDGVWWTGKVGENTLGAPLSPGRVQLPEATRAAWGMRWWGQRLQQYDWNTKSDQLLNLVLAAPRSAGGLPDTCTLEELLWDAPAPLYREGEMAYWLVRWLESWPDHARRADILAKVADALKACEQTTTLLATGRTDPTLDLTSARFLARLSNSVAMPGELRDRARVCLAGARVGYEPGSTELMSYGPNFLYSLETGASDLGPLANIVSTYQWVFDLPETRTYNEAGQFAGTGYGEVAEYAVGLLRAGAKLHRKDLFERGVAALKSGLNLLQESTLGANGVKLPAEIQNGMMAEGFSEGRFFWTDRRSFETCEGQLMANFAEVAESFGGMYVDSTGWRVGIDGCYVNAQGAPISSLSSNPFPYSGEHKVEVVTEGQTRKTVEVTLVPSICRMEVVHEAGKVFLVAIPGPLRNTDNAPKVSGEFTMVGKPWKAKGTLGLTGIQCPWPKDVKGSSFKFVGKINGVPVSFGPVTIARV